MGGAPGSGNAPGQSPSTQFVAGGAAGAAAGAAAAAGARGGRPGGPEGRTEFFNPDARARRNAEEDAHREPKLLTHLEPGPVGLESYGEEHAEEPLDDEEERMAHRKMIWRRVRRACYVLAAVGFIGPIVAFVITYALVDIPDPVAIAAKADKPITILNADGSQLARIAPAGARTMVTYQQVPADVRHAVEGAEDATFETNPGFDWHAIVRAVWIQATGGASGGSGITQQYIKQASGNDQRTITRKFTELAKAFKMNNNQDKPTIITAYLNTVYFGRGATGIQAAAKAYYNKDVSQLNPSEAALLGGLIQRPGTWDQAYAEKRWHYVMDQMESHNLISPQDRAKYPNFPQPVDDSNTGASGQSTVSQGFIRDQVIRELEAHGITQQDAQQRGMTITTTIDKNAQQHAEDAASKVIFNGKQPENLRTASVSIDPKTGGVAAYYGGNDRKTDFANSLQEPGSSFKPYDLAAGLKAGTTSLKSTYDGSSPQTIAGVQINNSDGESCNVCDVKTAMTMSLNTVFAKITADVGPDKVATMAFDAGVPKTVNVPGVGAVPTLKGDDINLAIGGGDNRMRPIDQATGYATLANDGQATKSHFILTAKDADGSTAIDNNKPIGDAALDKADPENNAQIARNVTEAMRDVATSSQVQMDQNRPVASKSGTHQYTRPDGVKINENSKAWYVGYTPQLVTAVWVGASSFEPIRGNYHVRGKGANHQIYGADEPAAMWQDIMNADLAGKPVVQFPKFREIGKTSDHSGGKLTTTPPPPPVTTTQAPTTTPPPVTDTPSEVPTDTTTKSKPRRPTPPSCVSLFCSGGGQTTGGAPTASPSAGPNYGNYGYNPPPGN